MYLTSSVRNWHPDFESHFNNAVGFWNGVLGTTVFANWPQDDDITRAWVLRAGSLDETEVNGKVLSQAGVQFEPQPTCGTKSVWATTYPALYRPAANHAHYHYQKICIRGNPQPNAPNAFNDQPGQDYHYWWLMFTHELGHLLSLADHQPGACVMLQGLDMRHPCSNEIAFVNEHYGLLE